MIYIIGLALAFIFGCFMGYEGRVWKIGDAKPLDLKLTEQDLFGPVQHPDDLSDIPVFYPYGGREC